MKYEFNQEDLKRFCQNYQCKRNGNEIVFKLCPYCQGGKNHDKNTFAISTENGTFNCKRSSCGITGNLVTLSQDFSWFNLGNDYDEYFKPVKQYRTFSKPKEFTPASDPVSEFLRKRCISDETAKRYNISTKKDDPNVLMFPFVDGDEVACVKYRRVNYDKAKDRGPKEWFEKDGKPILFGMQNCDSTEDNQLVITEGQMDALAVATCGIKNVVSVPNGCKAFTWVPYCYDFVERFQSIIVFGDNENGKITLVDDLAIRWRSKIKVIRSDDYCGEKDANDILIHHGVDAVLKAIRNADYLPIKKVISLSDVQKINVDELEKLPSGIHNLDKKLHGGLPFGGVTLITGKAGEGKSTFANQVIVNAVGQGYNSMIYSGEMPNANLRDVIDKQIAGRNEIHRATNQWGEDYPILLSSDRDLIGEWYRDRLFLYDADSDEEASGEGIIEIIKAVALRNNVRVVLLDNLMTAMDLISADGNLNEYQIQTGFMKKLVKVAKELNLLIILVAHKRKSQNGADGGQDDISGSSNIANLAMVTLSYERFNGCGQFERRLKIFKNRLFGTIDTDGITMIYDDVSRRVYNTEAEMIPRYDWKPQQEEFVSVTLQDDLSPF